MAGNAFEKYIKLFKPVMEAIQELMGDSCELILHDLSKPLTSVSAIAGNVTSRQLGAPVTNLVVKALEADGDNTGDILSYEGITKDGRKLRSSTIFIRDDLGHIIGCLCINLDLTDYQIAERLISNLCKTKEQPIQQERKNETFSQDISEIVEDIIRFEFNSFDKPVPMMNRNDKLTIMMQLEQKGVFGVKGTPEIVAQYMGASVFTIYNYLKEIRNVVK